MALGWALKAISSLGDPVRRSLYERIAEHGGALSRDEMASMTGVARPLAAYHLDRMVKDGLLDVRYERRTGRSGPGAGRPAKLYFRPKEPIQVSLPARDYQFLAGVLADAVATGSDEVRQAVSRVAEETGRAAAAEAGGEQPEEPRIETVKRVLSERGYEPATDEEGRLVLRNCVFDSMAREHRELVCGMNLSLVQGMLSALPECDCEASLAPQEGRCCVVLTSAHEGEVAPKD